MRATDNQALSGLHGLNPAPRNENSNSGSTGPTVGQRMSKELVPAPIPAPALNLEPVQDLGGSYIAEGRAKSGEKVYLRMEQIDNSNREALSRYKENTAWLVSYQGHGSMLSRLLKSIKKIEVPGGPPRFVSDLWESSPVIFGYLGLDRNEFDQLVQQLGEKGCADLPGDKRKFYALRGTCDGSQHMALTGYVIYASKSPAFRIASAIPADEPRQTTFKRYRQVYQDLLLSVGCFQQDGKWHARGISRNPISTIDDNYKGLTDAVLGFTGAVLKKFMPGVEELTIAPLAPIQYWICTTFGSDEYRIERHTQKEALHYAREGLKAGETVSVERPNHIKIAALDRVYRSHALPREQVDKV